MAAIAPAVTTTSIILCFNKHRLTQVTWRMAVKTEREIYIVRSVMFVHAVVLLDF